MKKSFIFKKGRIIGVIIILICLSFSSGISGFSKEVEKTDINIVDRYDVQDNVLVTCRTFGIPGKTSKETEMPYSEVEKLFDKINDLALEIARDPRSTKIKHAQQEVLSLADEYDLVPRKMSAEILQPRFISSLNLKNPILGISSVFGNRGTASFCNFVTTGSGLQLPIIILPRLIPILLTPIPRAFLIWNANEGVTSCGSFLTGTGFIAGGSQIGIALGFWGIGFSVFIPPIMGYGFIGYAMFATCTAEQMEPWPPNYPPEISAISPLDGATNVPISTSELRFQIHDDNGDKMNYTVTTNPDIGSSSGKKEKNGIYSIPISNLEGTEEYTWHVTVSDGEKTSDASYSFTTESVAPIVSNPDPEDGERYLPLNLSKLSFKLKDPQGDLMDYTIETSPDIGSGSATNVGEGIYTMDISGLDYSQEYMWFVNVTDGVNWKHKVFSFQADHKMVFDPFKEGWQYRKKITINHTKVTGDLENFPVLISTIDTDLQNKAQTDGDDILFMNDTGVATRLYHEIEQFNGVSGELVAWVNIPILYGDMDTVLYMYYGNLSSSCQQAPKKVWNTHYVMVQHMNEASGDYIDSTSYDNDGTLNDADSDSVRSAAGKIGKALDLEGDADFILVSDDAELDITNQITIETWVELDDHDDQILVSKRNTNPGNDYAWELSIGSNSGGNVNIMRINDNANSARGSVIPENQWCYLVGTYDKDAGGTTEIKLYYNNTIDGTGDYSTAISTNTVDVAIGKRHHVGAEGYVNGIMDEVRISDIVRNAAWISTSYNTMNDPLSFLIFGFEETDY